MGYRINRSIVLDGKRCWIHANTEQEYADKLLELVNGRHQEDGSTPQGTVCQPQESSGKHPFEKYAWNWFETFSKPNIATATALLYSRLLRCHILPVLKSIPVEDLQIEDLQRMFNSMDTSKETKMKARRLFNQIFNAALDDGLMSRNLLKSSRIKITGAKSKTTAVYSVEQMRYLLQHIDDLSRLQDRAYLAIQSLHPLRLEEVLGLKWSDVDLDNMALHINRAVTHPTRNAPEIKDTKTAGSVRTISLSILAVPYLTPGRPDEFVLGGDTPWSYSEVRRMRERIKRETKFEDDIVPMRFRTTILTDIYATTKDIKLTQAAAGHTTPNMTLKHYVKGREDKVQSTAAIESLYTV